MMTDETRRITYKSVPCFRDTLLGNCSVYWNLNKGFRDVVLTFLVIFLVAVLMTEGYTHIAISISYFVLGMWGLAILRMIKVALFETLDTQKQDDRERVNILDIEEGLVCDQKHVTGRLGWQEFVHIKETRRFFFLLDYMGGVFMIVKRKLPSEMIDDIREMLKKAPVHNKCLFETRMLQEINEAPK